MTIIRFGGLGYLVPRPRTLAGGPPSPPPPPPSGWAREIGLRYTAPGADTAGEQLFLEIVDPVLRPTANGGVLTDAQGRDIRFELEADGSALPFDLVGYDASAGLVRGFLRLGDVPSAQQRQVRLLAGKSGEVVSAAGVWNGALATWLALNGVERGGDTSRNATPTGITADTDKVWAARFDGTTSYLSVADASFLAGRASICIECLVRWDAPGGGGTSPDGHVLVQGPAGASNANAALMLRRGGAGFRGGATDAIIVNVRFSDGNNVRYESASGQAVPGVWRHVVFQVASGRPPELYVDGVRDVPSWYGTIASGGSSQPDGVATGTTVVQSGRPLLIGGDTARAAEMMLGAIGFVSIRASLLTSTEIRRRARALLDPALLYGRSQAVSTPPANAPVIAMPVELPTVDGGRSTLVDVVSAAHDPDDTPVLTSVDSTSGPVASATPDGNAIDIVTTNVEGRARVAFTLTGGTHSSSSVVVAPVRVISSGPEYPAAVRTISVSNGAELASALANARSGDHIVLENGNYSGTFATSVAGTPANPIVLRARNKLLATIVGTLNIKHPDFILWGLHFSATLTTAGAARLVVRRCTSNYAGTAGRWCMVVAPDVWFDRCEFWGMQTRCIQADPSAGGTGLRMTRLYFHDWGAAASDTDSIAGWGVSNDDTDIASNGLMEYCLFRNTAGTKSRENVIIKSSNNTVRGVHIDNGRVIQVRHGNNNRIEGCRVSGATAGINVFDTNNKIVTSVAENGAAINVMAGSVDGDLWSASTTGHPSAKRTKVTSCGGTLRVGRQDNASYSYRATDTVVENHAGTVVLQHETNTTQRATPTETGIAAVTLTPADVGPNAP